MFYRDTHRTTGEELAYYLDTYRAFTGENYQCFTILPGHLDTYRRAPPPPAICTVPDTPITGIYKAPPCGLRLLVLGFPPDPGAGPDLSSPRTGLLTSASGFSSLGLDFPGSGISPRSSSFFSPWNLTLASSPGPGSGPGSDPGF